jgi:phosphate transport system permease protein
MTDMAETMLFDPAAPLRPTGNLRRRQLLSRLSMMAATGGALIAVAVLGILIAAVIVHGAKVLSWHFLTQSPPEFGGNGGGIAPAIIGTALIVAAATAIAMPIGVLMAVYLTEFAGARGARPIRLVLDVMNGLPSIVIAIFIFGLLVVGHHQSGIAASIALAIIMLPLIARSAQEVLLLVPNAQREAADALGVTRWRSILGVILPAALGGILTGTVLAVARAAGETAPVLLLSSIAPQGEVRTNIFSEPVSNIPMYIFNASEAADPAGFSRAWGASFVLLMFILISSLGARALLARSRTKTSR